MVSPSNAVQQNYSKNLYDARRFRLACDAREANISVCPERKFWSEITENGFALDQF